MSLVSQIVEHLPTGRPIKELLLQVSLPSTHRTSFTLTQYFNLNSYSYDLTNTLQINLTRPTPHPVYNTHFMWNYHLLRPGFEVPQRKNSGRGMGTGGEGNGGGEKGEDRDDGGMGEGSEVPGKCSSWVLPFVHGFVDQASESSRVHTKISVITYQKRKSELNVRLSQRCRCWGARSTRH